MDQTGPHFAAIERLTHAEYMFCKEYTQHGDKSRAYKAAFKIKDATDKSVGEMASHLLAKVKIQSRIDMERAELEAATGFTAASALMRFLEIAMADPRELIELKVGCCRYCHGADGNYQWDMQSYQEKLREIERMPDAMRADALLPDITGGFGYDPRREPNDACVRCAGRGTQWVVPKDTGNLSPAALALYGGVKQTRNGIEIIIADRQKALENAARIIGAFKDNVRLDGTIPAMLDVIRETDPVVASQKYQELMRRTAPNGRGSQPTAH